MQRISASWRRCIQQGEGPADPAMVVSVLDKNLQHLTQAMLSGSSLETSSRTKQSIMRVECRLEVLAVIRGTCQINLFLMLPCPAVLRCAFPAGACSRLPT